MPFTATAFARKIVKLREDRGLAAEQASRATGITPERFAALEAGGAEPTGDEVLVLADTYLSDFTWLIEDDATNPDENLETLFRSEGDRLTQSDRQATAEFLHLCKSEFQLDAIFNRQSVAPAFSFQPTSVNHVQQGIQYAAAFRAALGLSNNALIPDLYNWLRRRGFRVFRRPLGRSAISGLFIRHPVVGNCILINSSEDQYRQRFSAAHEIGHALMDTEKAFNVSTAADHQSDNYIEMRASSFASAFLIPRDYLSSRGTQAEWRDADKIVTEADRLWVSVPALLSALVRSKLMDEDSRRELRDRHLRPPVKRDPELPGDLTERQSQRTSALLSRGLHPSFVRDCLEAYISGEISLGKVGDMLLVDPSEVAAIASDLGINIAHG